VSKKDAIEEVAWERGTLLIPVASPSGLQCQQLGLESYVFDDAIPPYLPRDVDSRLDKSLQNSDISLLVLTGEPKSGKTRSVVRLIKDTAEGSSRIFWLKPHPNSASELLRILESGYSENALFVLDGLQHFGLGWPGSLDHFRLQELMKFGRVIATVDQGILKAAEAGLSLPGVAVPSSLDRELLQRLRRASFELPARLSEVELSGAVRLYSIEGDEHLGIESLGAYFSAGSTCLNEFLSLKHGTRMEEAVHNGVLFCHAISQGGFSIEQIRSATEFYLGQISPNVIWQESLWDAAIERLSKTQNTGSSYSVIMRDMDNVNLFTLMPYVWHQSTKPKETRNFLNGWAELSLSAGVQLDNPTPQSLGVDLMEAIRSVIDLRAVDLAEELLSRHIFSLESGISSEDAPLEYQVNSAEDANAIHYWAWIKFQKLDYDTAYFSYDSLSTFLETQTDVKASTETWHLFLHVELQIAICLRKLGLRDEAHSLTNLILERDPTFAPAFIELGQLLEKIRTNLHIDYAGKTWEEPEGPTAAQTLELEKFSEEIEYCYRMALSLMPESAGTKFLLATELYYHKGGSNDEISTLLRGALDNSEQLSDWAASKSHDLLGGLEWGNKKLESAKLHYLQAYEALSEDYYLPKLAAVLLELGETKEAQTWLNIYLLECDNLGDLYGGDESAFKLQIEVFKRASNSNAIAALETHRLEAQVEKLEAQFGASGHEPSSFWSLETMLKNNPSLSPAVLLWKKRFDSGAREDLPQ
jgi:hypothetical protein